MFVGQYVTIIKLIRSLYLVTLNSAFFDFEFKRIPIPPVAAPLSFRHADDVISVLHCFILNIFCMPHFLKAIFASFYGFVSQSFFIGKLPIEYLLWNPFVGQSWAIKCPLHLSCCLEIRTSMLLIFAISSISVSLMCICHFMPRILRRHCW